MRNPKHDCLTVLQAAGISFPDARALRRISMTLHRWHELECGDSNAHGSWAIVRGAKGPRTLNAAGDPERAFAHDDAGKPYLEHHHYLHGKGKDFVSHTPLNDREKGARKRLAKIVQGYPGFVAYVQTDPRGCALYILRPVDLKPDDDVSAVYTRGIAVHK